MESGSTSIEQLVKGEFNGMSVAQRKVAEYLLHHPDEFALLTAKQISQEVGVSETTVIRLSYALGFSSFSEMQRWVREQMLKNKVSALSSPPKDLSSLEEMNSFTKLIENDISILRQTSHQLNHAEVWKAVDALIEADQVMIAGYRASYAAAYWFSYMLSTTRNNVQLCLSGADDYTKLFNLTDKSLMVIISFPRYSHETLDLANHAKKQNLKILAITDRPLSPVGRISDMTLLTDVNLDSGMTSMSSVISLLNLLIYGMMMRDQKKFQVRQQRLEQMYTASGVYIE